MAVKIKDEPADLINIAIEELIQQNYDIQRDPCFYIALKNYVVLIWICEKQ